MLKYKYWVGFSIFHVTTNLRGIGSATIGGELVGCKNNSYYCCKSDGLMKIDPNKQLNQSIKPIMNQLNPRALRQSVRVYHALQKKKKNYKYFIWLLFI